MIKEQIAFDEGTAAQYKNVLMNSVFPAIGEISAQLEYLEIGPLTEERFADLMFNGGNNTRTELDKQLDTRIRKSGLKSSKIGLQLRQESEEGLTEILQAFEHLRAVNPTLPRQVWDAVRFTGTGKPALNPESLALIDELCKVYVQTEKGASLREKHRKAQDSLNEFLSELKNGKNIPFLTLPSFLEFFDISALQDFSIQARTIDYDLVMS